MCETVSWIQVNDPWMMQNRYRTVSGNWAEDGEGIERLWQTFSPGDLINICLVVFFLQNLV